LLAIPAYRRRLKKTARALGVLLFAYLINWLPFAGIGRVMFLYHYLFAFIFSAMLLAYLVGSVFPEFFKDRYPRQQAVVGVCVLVAAGYVYLAPLAYGWPIAPQTQAIYSRLTN
jgi:dolichyl-phosphate-mannose-protein mannosyltransferase